MSNRFLNLKSIGIIGQIDETFYATAFEYAQAQIHTMAIMKSKREEKKFRTLFQSQSIRTYLKSFIYVLKQIICAFGVCTISISMNSIHYNLIYNADGARFLFFVSCNCVNNNFSKCPFWNLWRIQW